MASCKERIELKVIINITVVVMSLTVFISCQVPKKKLIEEAIPPESDFVDDDQSEFLQWEINKGCCNDSVVSINISGDYLWAGGMQGLIRWNLSTEEYLFIKYPINLEGLEREYQCADAVPCGVGAIAPYSDSSGRAWILMSDYFFPGADKRSKIGYVNDEVEMTPFQAMVSPSFQLDELNYANGIAVSSLGDCYLATNTSIYKWDAASESLGQVYQLPEGKFLFDLVLSDPNSGVVLGGGNEEVMIFNSTGHYNYSIASEDGLAAYPATKLKISGRYLITASISRLVSRNPHMDSIYNSINNRVDILELESLEIKKSASLNELSEGRDITDVELDKWDRLWFTVNAGYQEDKLYVHDFSSGQTISFAKYEEQDYLPDLRAIQIVESRLYLGTDQGLMIFEITPPDSETKIIFQDRLITTECIEAIDYGDCIWLE